MKKILVMLLVFRVSPFTFGVWCEKEDRKQNR